MSQFRALGLHRRFLPEGAPPPSLPLSCVHVYTQSAVSHSRHVCCVTQQKCLLCCTDDMVRHICCVTQYTCLLRHAADTSAISNSRHVCCVTQQTCLLSRTAGMSVVSRSRHVCCLIRQTCLRTAGTSVVSRRNVGRGWQFCMGQVH